MIIEPNEARVRQVRIMRRKVRIARERGLSMAEAVKETGLPRSTVKRLWNEARPGGSR